MTPPVFINSMNNTPYFFWFRRGQQSFIESPLRFLNDDFTLISYTRCYLDELPSANPYTLAEVVLYQVLSSMVQVV